jgi:hypothetical protein
VHCLGLHSLQEVSPVLLLLRLSLFYQQTATTGLLRGEPWRECLQLEGP